MKIKRKAITLTKAQRYHFWCKGPDYIPVRSILTDNKKRLNYLKLLEVLEMRSSQNNGDVKISDTKLAKYMGVDRRTVQNGLLFLERSCFITRIFDRVSSKTGWKTVRFIRVWTSFIDNKCIPVKGIWKNDIRPKVDKVAMKRLYRKYQTQRVKLTGPKTKISNNPNFVPSDPLMDKMRAQNNGKDFRISASVDEVMEDAYNDACSRMVPDHVYGRLDVMNQFRKEHTRKEYSLSMDLLGYPNPYWEKRRKDELISNE